MSVALGNGTPIDRAAITALIAAVGRATWDRRIAEILAWARGGQRAGRAMLRHHAVELTLDRMTRDLGRPAPKAVRLPIRGAAFWDCFHPIQ